MELGPYLLNAGSTALQSGTSVIIPLARYFCSLVFFSFSFFFFGSSCVSTGSKLIFSFNDSLLNSWTPLTPSTYDYNLWKDIFVAPITEANTTSREITFPTGNNYVDWWNPNKIYQAASTIQYQVPLNQFPGWNLFVSIFSAL